MDSGFAPRPPPPPDPNAEIRDAEIDKAGGLLPAWRWRHIVASALTPLLGLQRSSFMYGVVTARKA